MSSVAADRRIVQRARQVGNSLVVTIPKEVAEARGIRSGTFVAFDPEACELVPRAEPALAEVLDAIGPRSRDALNYLKKG